MLDAAIYELASRQNGSFSRSQVLSLGANDDAIDHRLRTGRWLPVHPGVYSLPGWPSSWMRALWQAHLDVGPQSAVSHEAAAALHGFLYFPPGPVVLTVAHGDHHRPGPGVVHQSRDLQPAHVTLIDGLPVTSPSRTVVDLAACTGRERLSRALDDAHVARRCSIDEVAALYAELRRPGKRGLKMLGRLLAMRGPGYVPTESELERRFLRVLRAGGLPEPQRQARLPWRADAPARVDFLYPRQRVIIEVDGRRWHTRMDEMATDRRRDREAQNHGYRVYRFVFEEITGQATMIHETLHLALEDIAVA